MKILVSNDPAKNAGSELNKQLKVSNRSQILLMLSGGSALMVLGHINPKFLSGNITVSIVDERFSMDKKINNFSQLEDTKFFDECLAAGCAIIGTRIHKGETLPSATMNFDARLREWRKLNPKGKIVALLGIGEDGHTAGVMPFTGKKRLFEDSFLDQEWVASFDATGKNEHTLRFTSTLTFLKGQVDHTIVFAQGSNKKEVLLKIVDKSLDINDIPAKILCHMKDVILCTDNQIGQLC